MFIFNDKFEKLIKMQVTTTSKDMSFYTKLSEEEYSVIKYHLTPFPKTILELGCGLGRMSIYLNKKHPSDSKYYLADSSIIPDNKKNDMYGWNSSTWYNDLSLTDEFCKMNGLENFEIINLQKEGIQHLKNIDLVFSVMSVGFHYPIENYLHSIKDILSKDGKIIFGVRNGVYKKSDMINKFDYVELYNIPNNKKEKLLVLKGFKDGVWE